MKKTLGFLIVILLYSISGQSFNSSKMLAKIPNLETCSSLDSKDYDGIIVVAPTIADIKNDNVRQPLESYAKIDASAAGGCSVVP